MGIDSSRDMALLDLELLQLPEVSQLALKEKPKLAEELYCRWLSLPETEKSVKSIEDAKAVSALNIAVNSSSANAAANNSLPSMFPAGSVPPLSPSSSWISPFYDKCCFGAGPSPFGSPLNPAYLELIIFSLATGMDYKSTMFFMRYHRIFDSGIRNQDLPAFYILPHRSDTIVINIEKQEQLHEEISDSNTVNHLTEHYSQVLEQFQIREQKPSDSKYLAQFCKSQACSPILQNKLLGPFNLKNMSDVEN